MRIVEPGSALPARAPGDVAGTSAPGSGPLMTGGAAVVACADGVPAAAGVPLPGVGAAALGTVTVSGADELTCLPAASKTRATSSYVPVLSAGSIKRHCPLASATASPTCVFPEKMRSLVPGSAVPARKIGSPAGRLTPAPPGADAVAAAAAVPAAGAGVPERAAAVAVAAVPPGCVDPGVPVIAPVGRATCGVPVSTPVGRNVPVMTAALPGVPAAWAAVPGVPPTVTFSGIEAPMTLPSGPTALAVSVCAPAANAGTARLHLPSGPAVVSPICLSPSNSRIFAPGAAVPANGAPDDSCAPSTSPR